MSPTYLRLGITFLDALNSFVYTFWRAIFDLKELNKLNESQGSKFGSEDDEKTLFCENVDLENFRDPGPYMKNNLFLNFKDLKSDSGTICDGESNGANQNS